ncbi:MAG: SDR family oxidoreductase [Candidatus Nitrosotenuis sp.]
MTKILVTGSAGLVGSQVTKDLVERKFDVYSCYNVEKPMDGILTHLDLASDKMIIDIMQSIKPEIVIHLAAITDVEMCETQHDLASLINTKSTKILAQESAKHDSFFVYMSTDYVFDGTGMKNEKDTPKPLNFYGKSKLAGEIATSNFASSYSIIRTSTPFGIHQTKKSFPIWIKEKLELKREIPVLIDQFTSPTFVPNLSQMLIEVITRRINGIIHLAGATRISRYAFAKIIADRFNLDNTLLKPTKISEMKWLAQRPQDSSLDVAKAFSLLNNKPKRIEESLEPFISQLNTSLTLR